MNVKALTQINWPCGKKAAVEKFLAHRTKLCTALLDLPCLDTLGLPGRVLILTVCAAGIGGTFQYGYNLTIINAPTLFIQTFANETWLERTGAPLEGSTVALLWSFVVSVFSLGGLAGALVAGPMAIRLGRKKSLLLSNLFVLLAAVLAGCSRRAGSVEMVMLSRFLAGVNSGVGMSVQPMYLGESAPKELRGTVALTSASFTALGLVLGQAVGLRELLGTEGRWPLLLASNAVPGLIQLLLLPWAPESPRYLLIDRGDQGACVRALRRLRGREDVSGELKELLAEQAAVRGEAPKAPWELLRSRAWRWQLLSVLVLSSAMQLCGNDSMYSYASSVFHKAGVPSDLIQYVTIGTGSCELITAVTCNLVIDRVGRRKLVMGGYSLMAAWAVVFTVALSLQDRLSWMPYLSMACIFAYILSFGIGPAGVTGILPAEIFDQVTRPAAYMICGSLLWSNLFLVGMAFPFLVDGLGPFCYLPFFAVCVCSALYVCFFLPETKAKTFLEISAEFNKRNFPAPVPEKSWTNSEGNKSTLLPPELALAHDEPHSSSQACPGRWGEPSRPQNAFQAQLAGTSSSGPGPASADVQTRRGQVRHQRLLQMLLVLGMGGTLLVGFQVSVIASPSQDIKRFINETWFERHGTSLRHETLTLLWSTIVSIYCVGGLLGGLWSGPLVARYGKKKAFLGSDVIVMAAALLVGFSEAAGSFEMILLGRFLYGVSAGISLNVHGPYLGEVSPKKLRGFVVTTASVFLSLGKALGQIMALRALLGSRWPLLLALGGVAALLQLLLLPLFPESPPYLLIQKGDREGCLKAMKELWGEGPHHAEMEDLLREAAAARTARSLGVLGVMTAPALRKPLGVTVLLILSLQLCGLIAVE
ncbi:hypothetical protein lerEdw1_019475 [Lerista edwardsae]|nr:hypothetical protein lerEdw1_019475 [Lerista edwardsae]